MANILIREILTYEDTMIETYIEHSTNWEMIYGISLRLDDKYMGGMGTAIVIPLSMDILKQETLLRMQLSLRMIPKSYDRPFTEKVVYDTSKKTSENLEFRIREYVFRAYRLLFSIEINAGDFRFLEVVKSPSISGMVQKLYGATLIYRGEEKYREQGSDESFNF